MDEKKKRLPKSKFYHTTLSPGKLNRAVAKSSGYHLYEVEDVLLHLAYVIQNSLARNESVYIQGVGKIKLVHRGFRKYYSGALKKEVVTNRSWLLKLQGDAEILHHLDNNLEELKEIENDSTIHQLKDNSENN